MDLPDRIEIAGVAFDRLDAPEELACWAAYPFADEEAGVSLLTEPPAVPGDGMRALAAEVIGGFDGLVVAAEAYLGEQLRDPASGLDDAERALLDGPEPPFAAPAATVYDDGTWLLRFADSPLAMADPYGIGVLFRGTEPVGVEDLSEADDA